MTQIKVFALYFLLIYSCSSKENLPILSRYIDSNGKEIIYHIKDFEFTDQLNRKFSTNDTKNKVYISNFFFTRCPSICPKMKASLIDIARANIKNPDFLIISISIDPEHDSIPILKQYAETTTISNSKWYFLNGNKKQLNHISTLFRTSFERKKTGVDFVHSSYAALVDKDQLIRGFYDLLDANSVNQLIIDARQLLK